MSRAIIYMVLIFAISCNLNEQPNEPEDIYNSIFKNKLDLNPYIKASLGVDSSKEYKVLVKRIKNGILIGAVTTSDVNNDFEDYYIFIFDLNKKAGLSILRNPFSNLDYREIEFDYEDGKIYACSGINIACVYYYDIASKSIDSLVVTDLNFNSGAGEIVVYGNMLIFNHSPLGALVYNTKTKKTLSLQNSMGNTISYIYATIALPLSSNMNTISGKNVNGEIFACLFDSSLTTRCWFNLNASNFSTGSFKMLSFDSVIVVFDKQRGQLIEADSCKIKQLFEYRFDFQNGFRLSDQNILGITAGSDTTTLFNLDIRTGKMLWARDFSFYTFSDKNIAVSPENKAIIVVGKDSVRRLNYNGEIEITQARRPDQPKSFQTFGDLINRTVYIISEDSSIYW